MHPEEVYVMVRFLKYFFFSLFLIFCIARAASTAATIDVYAVNYPLTYFAERIGGNYVNVMFPAPPDIDPAFWSPDPETIRKYQQADLIILNGAGYAKWTKKASLPMLRSVNTAQAFADTLIQIQTETTHSHGPTGEHSHAGTAFTTWLDFSQAAQQAEAIYLALAKKLPDYQKKLKENFQELETDLLNLDLQLLDLSALKPGIPLYGSHPIYQYLVRRYGVNMKMVMWEPDEDPGDQHWRELDLIQTEHPSSWMIWEDEPLQASIDRLAEMGIRSLVFSPCFNRPEKEDFLAVMKQNIKNLRAVYELEK
jgi:zinc transport system substrate-binding protein